MNNVSVIILTKNESLHIERCIASVSPVAKEIFVIDAFSSDQTAEIASALGATVLQHEFVNYSKQFQWALDNVPLTGDWVMRLDADEIIEPDLADEIRGKLPTMPVDVVGIQFKRKHIFMGRWVRHGGRYPLILLRLWRNGHGRIEDRWMDEHIVVWGGKTVTFDGGFADWNLNNLSFFTDKHNSYATREAIDVINQTMDLFPRDVAVSIASTSYQAGLKRFLKERVYNQIPFTVSALMYFLWRYIFQLGFLDGRSGLVYHFLQGYWYRFLVGAKVMEFQEAIAHLENKRDILLQLSRVTGRDLHGLYSKDSS